MGKIVKYCSSCEESFAEKFTFCPNCAEQLTAFEMKPVPPEAEPAPEPEKPAILDQDDPVLEVPEVSAPEAVRFSEPEPVNEPEPEMVMSEPDRAEPEVVIPAPVSEPEPEVVMSEETAPAEPEIAAHKPVTEEPEPAYFEETIAMEGAEAEAVSANSEEAERTEEVSGSEVEDELSSDEVEEEVNVAAGSKVAATGTFLGLLEVEDKESVSDSGFQYNEEELKNYDFDGEFEDENFHVTVISDRASTIRNGLLLGAFTIIFCGFLGVIVYSLFNNLDDVGSLVDDQTLISMLDEPPLDIEQEKPKDNSDEGGGGGGGGKQEEKPVSQGELATQMKDPITPPSAKIPKLPDPDLAVIPATEGTIQRARLEPIGLPDAMTDDPSDGPGTGGGMGRGSGTGLGNGVGTGEGNGNGSGSGNGNGNGIGNGSGSGTGNGRPSGPTQDIRILSKPRPGYTDEARQNNVRGTVILRVTFLASGRIGQVSTMKGLPYGLTEKAIAAARQIRFTPKLQNGQAVTVNKVVHFNFTIY